MSDCKIVRRVDYTIYAYPFNRDGKKIKFGKSWYGVCPHCGKFIKGKSSGYHINYSATNTRKTAKDALYRHILVNHS